MDFDFPPEVSQRKESSAAAIVAAALLRLAKLCADTTKGAFYDRTARRILLTLARPPYLASATDGWKAS